MRAVATITQPQGTPAVLVQSLPSSGTTTWVAGTPRSLAGEGDAAPPARMMVANGALRSARAVAVPIVTSREVARIVAMAALAALVAMAVAGLGRLSMGGGSSSSSEAEPPARAPLPTPVPVVPECPAVETTPPPPPPAVDPPKETAPPKTPISSEPFVIPSTLPPLPAIPGMPDEG